MIMTPLCSPVARKMSSSAQKIARIPKKSRVPDTFQLGAISAFFDFRARRFFNNLRVFNTPEYSNSPRLHHLFLCVFIGVLSILIPVVILEGFPFRPLQETQAHSIRQNLPPSCIWGASLCAMSRGTIETYRPLVESTRYLPAGNSI